jgi:antitoxin CptB
MTRTARSSAGLDERRRKLLYMCWHRGMREMDLILGRFANDEVEDLAGQELDDFERLTQLPDQELLGWITGECETPAKYNTVVFRRLRDFHWRSGERE